MVVRYKEKGINFLFHMKGSVFPKAFAIAAPCSILAAILKMLINSGHLHMFEGEDSILKETQAFAGFSFLVGFLIVFRTSQEYSRFWDGVTAVHHMQVEWFDAAAALASFSSHSHMDKVLIRRFMNTLIRLFSLLHASALAEMEGETGQHFEYLDFDLIDPGSIDEDSLRAFKASDSKVELIFTWIQFLLVDNISTGVLSIPPPILSRAFQEIGCGMVAYHDALRIAKVPFPFPYAQTCDLLLLLHWMLVPIVTTQWVSEPLWAAIFVLIQVFILWSLNLIAVEIENPFGKDTNDLDSRQMQTEMNRHLLLLLHPDTRRAPQLVGAGLESCVEGDEQCELKPFKETWKEIGRIRTAGSAVSRETTIASHLSQPTKLCDLLRDTPSGPPRAQQPQSAKLGGPPREAAADASQPSQAARGGPFREATADSLPSQPPRSGGPFREATSDSQPSLLAQRSAVQEAPSDSQWRLAITRQVQVPAIDLLRAGTQACQFVQPLHTRPRSLPEGAVSDRGWPSGDSASSEQGKHSEAGDGNAGYHSAVRWQPAGDTSIDPELQLEALWDEPAQVARVHGQHGPVCDGSQSGAGAAAGLGIVFGQI